MKTFDQGGDLAPEQSSYATPERAAEGNREPLLMIFIDGFPHHLLKEESFFINGLNYVAPLQPGFGFSVNIFVELYAGLTPDEVGFLNIWELDPHDYPGRTGKATPFLTRATQRLLDRLTRRPQPFSRFLHKVYERIVGEGNIGNIPFEYLPFFRRGSNSRPVSYIFDELGMKVFRHEQIPGSIWERDEAAFHQATDSIKQGDNVFVTFGSLDYTGHMAGPGSIKFAERAMLVDGWCQGMIEAFLAAHSGNGRVVICSDHGHADVHSGVSLDIEKEFGKPGHDRYWYFVDSTMARFWVKDPQLHDQILDFLHRQGHGTVLDSDRRAAYGISDDSFMDIVFVLQEGKILWPSWGGGWFPKGMHGYLPEELSQQGIFVFHDPQGTAEISSSLPTRSREVHRFLRGIVG